MTHIAQNLKKYYERRKDRFIFKEGFSLNELAMATWQEMGYQRFDSSTLSKIVNGKCLLNLEQLSALAKLLKLTESQFIELSKSLANDLLAEKGFIRKLNADDRLSLNEILDTIKRLRLGGFPEYGIQLGKIIKLVLKLNLLSFDLDKSKDLFFNLDLELVRCYGESVKTDNITSLTKELNQSCLDQAMSSNNHYLADMAYMNYGGCLYVGREWNKSAAFLEQKVNIVNDVTKIEMYRTLLLNYALLQDLKKYKRTFRKATDLLNLGSKNNLNESVSLIEAIARSLSLFGFNSDAKSLISEVEKLSVAPFFQSQIIRCKAVITLQNFRLNKKIDIYEIDKIEESISFSIFFQYTRHLNEINNIINILRNKKTK